MYTLQRNLLLTTNKNSNQQGDFSYFCITDLDKTHIGMRAAIKDFPVSFRNYCYAETKNSKDESYAEGAHLQMFMAIVFVYMCVIPGSLLIIALKAYPILLSYLKAYVTSRLVLAVTGFLVIGRMTLQWTQKVAAIPIDRNWGNAKLRQLRPIYVIFMLLSLVTLFASLYVSSKIALILDF